MSAWAAFKTGWCRKSVQYSSGNGSNPQMGSSRSRIRDSISVQMSVALMLVYLLFGAIYGLLGAAGGLRGAFLVIILLGLNLFSGGGEVAHVAGLVTGLALHRWGDLLARVLKGEI